MEEIKGDASKNVDEASWMVANFVSQEVTVVSQATSEEEILGDNSTQNLTQTQDSQAKNKDENTRNEEQNVACAYKEPNVASNIEEINNALNNAEDSKFTESSFRSRSPINNQEVNVKQTRNEQRNIFTANADTSTISVNQEEDKKINYFEEFDYCCPRSVSPGDLVIVETDECQGHELKNTANLDTTNGNNSVNVNTPSTSREVSNVPPVLLRSVEKVLPTVDSNVHDRDLKTVNTYIPILNYEHNNKAAVTLNQILLGNKSSVVDLSKNVTSNDTADILPEEEQNNDTSDPIGNVADNSTDPNYMYPNGHFSQISNYNRRVGLYNNGSTCYINSVMQALLATNKFSTFTVMKMYMQFNEHCWWSRVAELFGNMMFTIHPIVNPKHIYSKLNSSNFNIFQEHDASEFLLYLLPQLKRCEPDWDRKRSRSKKARLSTSADLSYSPEYAVAGCSYQTSEPTSRRHLKIASFDNSRKYIDNLFGSIIAMRITCQVCQKVSNITEKVLMMHLSFPDVNTHEALKVQSLLNGYFSTEMLTGENCYRCENCKKRQVALMSSNVVHGAKYLIITLKNFRYDTERKVLSKKLQNVHCDENIVLQTKTNQKHHTTYNLYAVIVHRGHCINTGHYTAFTKYREQWYKTNDKIVSSVEASDINHLNTNETPYILFYKRSDIKEGEFPQYCSIPWLDQYAVKKYEGPQG